MNLDFTDEQLAFQAEARAWLEANVPAKPLPSMDTPGGFAEHVFGIGAQQLSRPGDLAGRA